VRFCVIEANKEERVAMIETAIDDPGATDLIDDDSKLPPVIDLGNGASVIPLYDDDPEVILQKGDAEIALSSEQMWNLVDFWIDGYCSACGDSIPQFHHLCEQCAREEANKWNLLRM